MLHSDDNIDYHQMSFNFKLKSEVKLNGKWHEMAWTHIQKSGVKKLQYFLQIKKFHVC